MPFVLKLALFPPVQKKGRMLFRSTRGAFLDMSFEEVCVHTSKCHSVAPPHPRAAASARGTGEAYLGRDRL
jgi:hypothetical protein